MLQQDSYIEDQKLLLSERALTRTASRPSSLIEQEKQRSLEKQRQDLANLQRQQAHHQEEKRRHEREWEARERALQEREARLAQREDELRRSRQDLERERDELQQRKDAYQGDLERLRAAQRLLEREQEQLRRDSERLSQVPGEDPRSPDDLEGGMRGQREARQGVDVCIHMADSHCCTAETNCMQFKKLPSVCPARGKVGR